MNQITKAVFPVAGLGTRFLPATKASAKEMLPVVDKPLIQYAVEEAVAAGMTEMIFVTGRGKRAIEDHFDINYELEHEIAGSDKENYLREIRRIMDEAGVPYAIAVRLLNGQNANMLLLTRWQEPGKGETRLLSLLRGHRMKSLLRRLLDESEFLSDYGVRALSKVRRMVGCGCACAARAGSLGVLGVPPRERHGGG